MFPGLLAVSLLSVSAILAHPLHYRALSGATTATIAKTTSTSVTSSVPTSSATSAAKNETHAFDLNALLEGNKQFRARRNDLNKTMAGSPDVMFISCSDNPFSSEAIFQTKAGGAASHINIANQFSGKDANSNAAVAYAVRNLGVKHIVVIGHYGCKGVRTAMTPKPKSLDKILQTWLQSIIDIYSQSKRVEIKKLRDSRKSNNIAAANKVENAASRALVEENVKANVKNIMNESILSIAYHKKADEANKLEVYGHGFVFDEETGEVKDLGVSFGPPGKTIPVIPFGAIAEPRLHHQFGKFKAKAKKLTPTSTSTSVTSTSSSTTTPTPTN